MPRSFSRTVLITGASSGIGKALAEEFASRGDIVMASARRIAALRQLARSIGKKGGTCHAIPCDVTKEREVHFAIRSILRRAPRIDILVNVAGITTFDPFLATSTAVFRRVIETNLTGMFLVTRGVVPGMLRRKSGMVINVLSFAARTTYTGSAAYSASKAGGAAMMNVLREELRDYGIRVINVYPGAVLTPIWHRKHHKKYGNRMMRPEELARLLYEISRQPEEMTVEEIVVRPKVGDLKV